MNCASFNGGAGGVAAKPTNEELGAEKEQHVQATKLQVGQARAASMRGEQFVSTNSGKPAIVATARPGEFKGKGVVPARAAGKAAEVAPPPTGNVPPETKEKPPTTGQPAAPGLAPNAQKPGEKPPAVEKLGKPEAIPNAGKVEESLRRPRSRSSPRRRPSCAKG